MPQVSHVSGAPGGGFTGQPERHAINALGGYQTAGVGGVPYATTGVPVGPVRDIQRQLKSGITNPEAYRSAAMSGVRHLFKGTRGGGSSGALHGVPGGRGAELVPSQTGGVRSTGKVNNYYIQNLKVEAGNPEAFAKALQENTSR